nr:MAG TPA: hypothetical protein [Caudoviricetes sp.]
MPTPSRRCKPSPSTSFSLQSRSFGSRGLARLTAVFGFGLWAVSLADDLSLAQRLSECQLKSA